MEDKKVAEARLESLRAALANARAEQEEASQRMIDLEEQLADVPQYKRYIHAQGDRADKAQVVRELEYQIKRYLGAFYADHGRPEVKGLGIRVYRVVDLLDERLAVAALIPKMPSMLKVDRKSFDSLMKELDPKVRKAMGLGPAVVQVTEDPRPTIAGDLSEYLTCRICGKPKAGTELGWLSDERAHTACLRAMAKAQEDYKADMGLTGVFDAPDHPGA